MNANNPQTNENLNSIMKNVNFYEIGIKSYLDIKDCHNKSVLINMTAIDTILIDIKRVKQYGNKEQLKTLKTILIGGKHN